MGFAYAEDGAASALFSETLHLAIDRENEIAFRGAPPPYRNQLKLRPGKYRLKLAVADEKGKVGSAEQLLVIPASSSPPLIQDLQTKLLATAIP